MITFIKISILAFIFIVTSGTVFSSWFKNNKTLVILAAAVSLVGSYYLGRSIYNDFQNHASVLNKKQLTPALEQDGGRSDIRTISSDQIWNPPTNIDIYRLCNSDGCLVDAMQQHGAPQEAIAFSEELAEFGAIDTYMYGFREYGMIDVAYLVSPLAMSEGGQVAFVNGRPEIMLATNLIGYQTLRQDKPQYLKDKFPGSRDPTIWSFVDVIKSHSGDGGSQIITTRWDVRDGCRACDVLGYIEIDYIFAATGSYFGYKLGAITKA